jgi:hypothetical protein
MGTGLPSFYIADLGHMNFTLGLSGWTTNDWSRAGNFDLMAPRFQSDGLTQQKVLLGLKNDWQSSTDKLSAKLHLDSKEIHGSLSALIQSGKVIYDINKSVYRYRPLRKDALPIETLRYANDREARANKLLKGSINVKVTTRGEHCIYEGNVTDENKTEQTRIVIDKDERMISGRCTCDFYRQNEMRKGPCEHMLAIRLKNNLKRNY